MALISMQNETFFDQLSNTAVCLWSELQSQRLENGFMWTCVFKEQIKAMTAIELSSWLSFTSERGSSEENHRAPIAV